MNFDRYDRRELLAVRYCLLFSYYLFRLNEKGKNKRATTETATVNASVFNSPREKESGKKLQSIRNIPFVWAAISWCAIISFQNRDLFMSSGLDSPIPLHLNHLCVDFE